MDSCSDVRRPGVQRRRTKPMNELANTKCMTQHGRREPPISPGRRATIPGAAALRRGRCALPFRRPPFPRPPLPLSQAQTNAAEPPLGFPSPGANGEAPRPPPSRPSFLSSFLAAWPGPLRHVGSSQPRAPRSGGGSGNGVGSLQGAWPLAAFRAPGSRPPSTMKLPAGLLLPGLWLLLLACCPRVQSSDPAKSPVPLPSNATNHTSTAPVVKPVSSNPQNGTTVPPAVISNTTTSTTTTNATAPANITTTTTTTITTTAAAAANHTTAKGATTNATTISPKSPSVTTATPKAPSSANTTTVTATAKAASNVSRSSGFDVGSFIGGIVLTLGLLVVGYIGCRTYHAKRGVQYRTIDEHDAII
ncbi:porimin [Paroedura picta]|uniref:porimin n=1 Tax=Paroedura picta TaxID=143630 RepID=UPI004057C8A3